MFDWILRLFVKNHQDVQNPSVRQKYGALAGWTGIVLNALLFTAKMLAALFSSSVAIAADALNNLSDAAASVITVFGFHLSGKPADKKHPYGHARFEYLFGFLISVVITVLGVQTLLASVKNLIAGTHAAAYSAAAVVVVALSLPVKLLMALFVRKLGRAIASKALAATAADSVGDVVTTAAILAGMLLTPYTGPRTDGVLGSLVSVYIIFLGLRLIVDTANPLIGAAPDTALIDKIQARIAGYDHILGVHDMKIHNYGAGRSFASAHVEVDAGRNMLETHDLIDRIERDLAREFGLDMILHMDPVRTGNPDDHRLWAGIAEIVRQLADDCHCALSVHDFRFSASPDENRLYFDLDIPSSATVDADALCQTLCDRVKIIAPDCKILITIDRGYTSKYYEEN